jgi:hypothetical protein
MLFLRKTNETNKDKKKMKTSTCKICGKVIEGFNQRHSDFLLLQHGLSHRVKSQNKVQKDKGEK